MQPKPRPTYALAALCAALVPAAVLLELIRRYAVDVPFWDQWDVAPFFEHYARGTLTAAELFKPQNEYRQFFPNLLFLALGRLTRWDVRCEMLVSFALACLVAFLVYRLGKITVVGGGWQRPLAFLVSSLLIFSPIQYENWLFGVQVVYFVPVACVACGLVVARSGLGARAKFLLCMLLATLSTFSSANGIICWLVLLPALVRSRGELKVRRGWVAAWVAGFALNLALYLYGFERPATHPSVSEPLVNPLGALRYFLAWAGGPLALGPRPLIVGVGVGVAILILFAAACAYFFKRRGGDAAGRAAPWLMLGAFSILTGALVTFGRAEYGAMQALSSRYTTFSLLLFVALAHLAPIFVEDQRAEGRGESFARAASRIFVLAAAGLVLSYPVATLLVIRHGMRVTRRERLHLKACLLLSGAVEDECAEKLYTQPQVFRERAAALDRLGFVRPPLLKSARVREFEASGIEDNGSFDALEVPGGGRLVARGRALLPRAHRAADAVLLAYEDAGGEPVVFALAEVGGDAARGVDPGGWRKSFALDKLPVRNTRLSAYAFDSLEGKAYKLSGAHEVKPVTSDE